MTILALVAIGWGIKNSIVLQCGENASYDFAIDLVVNMIFLITLYLRGRNIVKQKSILEDGAEIGFLKQLDARVSSIFSAPEANF